MTLRRRMALAFAVILSLFALNLLVHLWTDRLRHEQLVALEHAESRQLLVATLAQQLEDRGVDAELLAAAFPEGGESGEAEWELLAGKLADLDAPLADLRERTPVERRQQIELLATEVERLRAGWLANRGTAPDSAAARRLVDEELAGLAVEERLAVDRAADEAAALARTTSRVTVAFLLLSTLVAVGVAVSFSRQLDARLGALEAGATRIGRGELDHPIPVPAQDELGRLAEAFNEMAARLAALRQAESRLRQEEKMASLGKV
ncbi:MAG TPA: HAMP domain-containing protein, partial [Thermoanaerobaculia bacterium]|nr:HAMP domain-containing protein [Thermoanaerobaculia bacterium]